MIFVDRQTMVIAQDMSNKWALYIIYSKQIRSFACVVSTHEESCAWRQHGKFPCRFEQAFLGWKGSFDLVLVVTCGFRVSED